MSQICNLFAAKRTAVLTFTNPLLDAFCVEDMLFVAKKRGNEVIFVKVTPADRALLPETILTCLAVLEFLFLLGLLVLKFSLVQGG